MISTVLREAPFFLGRRAVETLQEAVETLAICDLPELISPEDVPLHGTDLWIIAPCDGTSRRTQIYQPQQLDTDETRRFLAFWDKFFGMLPAVSPQWREPAKRD